MSVSGGWTASGEIYGNMGLSTLLGRSWNLFRYNLKPSVLLVLVPTILNAMVLVLYSIPSAFPTLTHNAGSQLVVTIVAFLAAILVWFAYWFAFGFSCCALSRIHYSAILQDKPISLKEGLLFVKRCWPQLFLIYVVLMVLYFVFVTLDILVFIIGFFFTMALVGVIATQHSPILQTGAAILAVFGGCLIVATLAVLVILQGFVCLFPLVAVSTSDGKNVMKTIGHSLKILFANTVRVGVFGFLLWILSTTLVAVFQLPLMIWMAFEIQRLVLSQQYASGQGFPIHISIISNLWANIINLIVLPYLCGSVTLFWYDCKVRSEGLDIRMLLNRLVSRRQRRPGGP